MLNVEVHFETFYIGIILLNLRIIIVFNIKVIIIYEGIVLCDFHILL